MKTLYPVDKDTYAKIGKAYLICAEYPEVFGKVTFKKFCSMFVDVIEDDEDEYEARLKENASEMNHLLIKAYVSLKRAGIDEPLRREIDKCLCRILEGYTPTDEEAEA